MEVDSLCYVMYTMRGDAYHFHPSPDAALQRYKYLADVSTYCHSIYCAHHSNIVKVGGFYLPINCIHHRFITYPIII